MATGDSSDLDLVPVSARSPQPEQRLFGRFTLKRVLGRGGMGIVWLAVDEELQRNVAMKFLPDMLIRDPDAVKDLKRETRRSLDLTHHHIVRIYDFIQDDSSAAIVMEYVDGESLSSMKSKQPGGCFGPSEIASWVSHFCMAMDYAHSQARVVHRDLKPANLMLNSRSELKVTDFGISRSLSDSMTRVSLANNAGTLAYMSPEQALGSPPAPADDIYAFGATLYDLLTGRPPFFRGNLQVQLETVMPPPLMLRRKELDNEAEDVPPEWEEVIMACLAKRPEDRPRTLGEAGQRLGVLGTTGMRVASAFTGTEHLRAPATSATGAGGGENPPTAQQVSAEAQKTPTSATQKALRHTTLDDILGYAADRTIPAAPATAAKASPASSPSSPEAEAGPEFTLPGKPLEASPASAPLAEPTPSSVPTPPLSSPGRATSAPIASPAKSGKPWLWMGAVGVIVIAGMLAFAWPKGGKGKLATVEATPAPTATGNTPETAPNPAPAAIPAPVQPAVDPVMAKVASYASAAEDALDKDDLASAKREISALEQAKPDYPGLAALSKRLEEAEAKVRQIKFDQFVAEARRALGERDFSAAKEAIAKAADIQDGDTVGQLRASLAKLETPPATPAPVAVAPAATPAPTTTTRPDKPDPEPVKPPVASTRTRPPEPRKVEPPKPRPTPRPQARAEPPPEPKATPKPAVSQTTPKPTTRKVFSIPGS